MRGVEGGWGEGAGGGVWQVISSGLLCGPPSGSPSPGDRCIRVQVVIPLFFLCFSWYNPEIRIDAHSKSCGGWTHLNNPCVRRAINPPNCWMRKNAPRWSSTTSVLLEQSVRGDKIYLLSLYAHVYYFTDRTSTRSLSTVRKDGQSRWSILCMLSLEKIRIRWMLLAKGLLEPVNSLCVLMESLNYDIEGRGGEGLRGRVGGGGGSSFWHISPNA